MYLLSQNVGYCYVTSMLHRNLKIILPILQFPISAVLWLILKWLLLANLNMGPGILLQVLEPTVIV